MYKSSCKGTLNHFTSVHEAEAEPGEKQDAAIKFKTHLNVSQATSLMYLN